jgi:glycosyltransferase involved in cell wall biosynthesis
LITRFIKATFIILRKINETDTIFANGLFQETAVAILLRKKKAVAKIVGDPVWERASNRGETNLNLSEFNQSKLKTKHKLQRYILAWSLNQFSYITCPSIQLIDLLKKWGVTKPIVLVTNGVKKVQQKKTNSDYDLITVCRLISLKNVDKIILASKNTNIKLAIIGTGPQQNELYKLSQSIGANVDFLGNLSSREVIITLLKSKIYINLSNHEGLSFSLLEAMSCGLPSVVSNIKGNTDVISNGVEGLVVELSDTKSIENAIKVLIKSPELQLKYGNAAKVKSQEQ